MRNKLEIFATGVASTGFCPDQVGGGKKGVGGWKKGGGGGDTGTRAWRLVAESQHLLQVRCVDGTHPPTPPWGNGGQPGRDPG